MARLGEVKNGNSAWGAYPGYGSSLPDKPLPTSKLATTMAKLDDVSWHLNGDSFPEGLPEENAATHMGCFVAWAIKRGLWGGPLADMSSPAVEAVARGRLSGRSFLLQECDGKLLSEMLNPQGAAFAEKCYDPYIKDYKQLLTKGLSSDYLVEDNAANQHQIDAVLDQRFAHWKRDPWWKFW